MADDNAYSHQVEVYSDSEDDYSSEVESSDVSIEDVEAVEEILALPTYPVSPGPAAASSSAPSGKKNGNASKDHPSQAKSALRAARNLDVEVTGPTEDHLFLEGTLFTQWGSGGSSLNLVKSFCRLADMVFYVYNKPGSNHPRKFLNCENLMDIQPGSLAMNEFKLIDKNKREFKLRAANPTDFGAWVKAFQSALARRQRAANKSIKVWFMDISNVSVVIERGVTTAEDLWWLVCEALNLADDARDAFCIWIMGSDLQVQLCNEDVVTSVLEDWHTAYEARYSSKLEGPPRLVFRTAPSLGLSTERNMKDPKAVHLFYLQAAYNVLYQNYVIDLDTAISLAGLAAQIRLGDFDRTKHKPGYIANNLRRYIPHFLQGKHKKTLSKWELLVAAEHATHKNKSLLIAEMLYLQRCRQIPYYGCIFFPTKNRDKARESGYWSQQTQGSINIGVNMEGVHICRDLKYLHSYSWRNITHWEVEQGKYFFFTGFANKPGKGVKSTSHTYLLETKAAPLIKEHLQDLVYEVKRAERVVSKLKKEQDAVLLAPV